MNDGAAPATIRLLGADDLPVFDRVAPDVFDDPIDRDRAAECLADPRHHIVVALVDDVVIGMASAVHYVHPDKGPELWVNEVSVAEPHRQHGVGQRMLRTLFAHARTLGCSAAWLGTDASNVAARALYASVGGMEAPMVYVTFPLDSDSADTP